ncbi:MAG: hydrogenase maturation protease [Rhodomicrobium sp.]
MTEPAAARKVLVACIGNPDRADDGIGALVAETLKKLLPAHASLILRRSDMLSLIDDFAGCSALVCVDGAAPAGSPGRIHRIDLASAELPRELLAASTHGFGLADAIELARALDCAPPTIVIYAIEGSCFDAGAPMTQAVQAAAEEAASLAAAEVARLSASEAATSSSKVSIGVIAKLGSRRRGIAIP